MHTHTPLGQVQAHTDTDRFAVIVPDYGSAFTVNILIKTTWGKLRTSKFMQADASTVSPTVFVRWTPCFQLPVAHRFSNAVEVIEYVHLGGELCVGEPVQSSTGRTRTRKYKLSNMQPLDEDELVVPPSDDSPVVAKLLYRSNDSTTPLATTIAVVPNRPVGYLDLETNEVSLEYPTDPKPAASDAAVQADLVNPGPATPSPAPQPQAPVHRSTTTPEPARNIKVEAEEQQRQAATASQTAPRAKILDIVTYDNSATVSIAVVSAYNSGAVAWPPKTALGVVHPNGTKSKPATRPCITRPVLPGEGFTFSVAITLKTLADAGRHSFFVQLGDVESAAEALLIDFPDCSGRGFGKRKMTKRDESVLTEWMQGTSTESVEAAFAEAAKTLDRTIQDKLTFKQFALQWPVALGAKRRRGSDSSQQ